MCHIGGRREKGFPAPNLKCTKSAGTSSFGGGEAAKTRQVEERDTDGNKEKRYETTI